MKKLFLSLFALFALIGMSVKSNAVGWPANYEGVMLQGFYWDSYKGGSYGTTKWANLTSQADELSKYFKLIWVPNSARANGENGGGNGYMPIYWFTNHNSAFGTEAELKTMISTFKSKGVGFIEDVVVNHRVGYSNWYNFPKETWNGQTWELTNGAICSTDEMWKSGGQGCPYTRGNADTGEDFDGARDLDHTNTTVQNHVKNYCKFLIDDMGYVGFRLDMVKGYSGQYTKIYNQYSKPTFSVGEYWDGNYDAVARWIDATGRESAAFDFPAKYNMHEAFNSNDMRKLAWTNPDGKPQPGGMMHYGYTQLSVTFVDNHDTFRDAGNKFPQDGNVLAAYAFILSSPGTPCVFWPHYYSNKSAIQALINARNSVGVHNLSQVDVVKLEQNCYAAIVTGSRGKLAVKIGSDMSYNPGNGFTMAASGTNYCVWTTNSGGVTPTPTPTPSGDPFTVYFDNSNSNWTTPYIHYWGASESTWPGVAMTKVSGNVWSYTVPAGTTGILFNAGDGDATKTSDFVAQANHIYNTSGDQGVYNGNGGNGGNGGGNTTDAFNIYFDNSVSNWTSPYIHYWGGAESTWPGVAMSKVTGNIWVYKVPAGTTGCLFNAGDGDATKTSDFVAQPNHIYTTAGDQGVYSGATPDPTPNPNPGTYPTTLYLIGNVNGYDWSTSQGVSAQGNNGSYSFNATIDDAGEGVGYFAFATVLGADWDTVNSGDRYGAPAENTPIAVGQSADIAYYQVDVNASASQSWMIAAGAYTITANLATMKVTVSKQGDTPVDPDPTPNPNPNPGTPGGLYLVGECTDWATLPAYEFSNVGNNTYTLYLQSLDGQFKVKDADPDWKGVNLGGDTGGEDVPTVDAIVGMNMLWQNSSVNLVATNWTRVLLTLTYVKGEESAMLDIQTGVDGINSAEIDSQLPVEYYNLQGVRIYEPTNGLYIRRQGSNVSKVLIK